MYILGTWTYFFTAIGATRIKDHKYTVIIKKGDMHTLVHIFTKYLPIKNLTAQSLQKFAIKQSLKMPQRLEPAAIHYTSRNINVRKLA